MIDPAHFVWGKGALGFTVLALVLTAERLFPAVRVRDSLTRLARNFGLAAINLVLSPLVVVPLSAFAAQWALAWRPLWWSGIPGLFLDLILLDGWIYLWHRLNHVVPALWRFHEVHHLDEHLDGSSALRFHFGEVLLSALVRAGVIFIFAIPLSSVVVFETLLLIVTVFHHSNLRLPATLEQALSLVMVTPSLHWVHHHAKREDTDSNYATVLSFWDLLFKSRSPNRRFPSMKIGVEGHSDFPLFRLIVRPFRR
jgi:sterol desaturase/sphingolipid hydroxylase (fatty acid hydroxylase superfamily)